LEFYRKVLALRHTNSVLLEGNYSALNEDDPNVLSYLRTYKGKSVLVALNMSGSAQKASFHLGGPSPASLHPLVATPGAGANGPEVTLPAFAVFIGEVASK
jgi:glycosidase